MAKRVSHESVFDGPIFKPTIEEAKQLIALLVEMKISFKDIMVTTKNGIVGENGQTLASINKITEASKESTAAGEAQAKVIAKLTEAQKAYVDAVTNSNTETAQAKVDTQILTADTKRLLKEKSALTSLYDKESAKLNRLRKEYKELAVQNKENTKEGKALLKSITDLDTKLKDVDATVGQHQRSVGNYKSALEGLQGPLGNAVTGLKTLGNSMLALLKNPVALFIAGIAGALYGLFKAFTSTDSGGVKFQVIMEQVGAVVDVVKQRVAGLASGIVNLFSGNWEEAAADFKGAVTGVGEQLEKATAAAAAYVRALDAIEDAEISYISTKADNENKIARLEFMAADKSLSIPERREALKEAIKLSEEEIKTEAKFARDKYNIEVKKLADTQGIDAQLLHAFIVADDKKAEAMMAGNAKLAKVRNLINDEGQIALEESYAKIQQIDTRFFNENKRNQSRLTGFDEQIEKDRQEIRDKGIEDLKKSNEKIRKEWEFMDAEMWKLEQEQLAKMEKLKNDEREAEEKRDKDSIDKARQKVDAEIEIHEFIREKEREFARIGKKEAELKRLDAENQFEDEMRRLNELHDKGLLSLHSYNRAVIAATKARENALQEIEKDAYKARVQRAADATKELITLFNKADEKKQKALDKEIKDSKTAEDFLRAKAAAGNKTAEQSLAEEIKKGEKAEAEKEKLAKKARKRELLMAGINTYNNEIQSGKTPIQALGSTAANLALLGQIIAALPGFYEGTEKVEDALNPVMKGRDGYIVRVDGPERIMDGDNNAKTGGMSNTELGNVADLYNRGMLINANRVPVIFGGADARTLDVLEAVEERLEIIAENTAFHPSQKLQYDPLKQMLSAEYHVSRHKVERTVFKAGGL